MSDVYDRPCSHCGAASGSYCRTAAGQPLNVTHRSRVRQVAQTNTPTRVTQTLRRSTAPGEQRDPPRGV